MAGPITTHILDTSCGRPAADVAVVLWRRRGDDDWFEVGAGVTDADGRVGDLLSGEAAFEPGIYRLIFEVGAYFDGRNIAAFYRSIPVVFVVDDIAQHYHVPLLLNPFGYSTYRGS